MSETLLTGARVVDPATGTDCIKDIGICDGKFATPESLASPHVIDLCGKVACPGFIDLHVHLRDPGQTWKEDLDSGSQAACHGGFTTVLAMPNTVPAMDTVERFQALMARTTHLPVHVLQSVCITEGRMGVRLADLRALAQAGAPAFTDDGSTTQDISLMRQAMTIAAELDLPVIDHCENTALSKPGVMHEGAVSRRLGLRGQPRLAEESIVERDLQLAEETGCRIHLQHLSSGGSVELLRQARAKGVRATGEATPHHLFLTDEACLKWGTNTKMAPPLREESDRQALIGGIQAGVITAIATDHAPHTAEEKAQSWDKAPFGIVGIEAVVPLCLTELVHRNLLSLSALAALFTTGPAAILGLPLGTLAIGAPADLTILDLEKKYTLHTADFVSRGKNCPYEGWQCCGAVVGTFLQGEPSATFSS